MGQLETLSNCKHQIGISLRHGERKLAQDALSFEADTYGDIIQGDFLDSYRNLTYKAIMGLRWVSTYCKHAKFLLKTDDDVFVNIFNLVALLRNRTEPAKKSLMCITMPSVVLRDKGNKWYVTRDEYPNDTYPTYCGGLAFLLTTDVADALFEASLDTPFFWIDDIYVTGILASKVGVVHENIESMYEPRKHEFLQRFSKSWRSLKLIFGHVHNLDHIKQVWNYVTVEQNKTTTIIG